MKKFTLLVPYDMNVTLQQAHEIQAQLRRELPGNVNPIVVPGMRGDAVTLEIE